MNENDYVSLVLLTYLRPDYTQKSISSLLSAKNKTPYELIVCDDGSRDANWTMLLQAARAKNLSSVFINAGQNMGVGTNMQRGFQASQGKYVCKLDADLIYKDGWLDSGVAILEKFPDVGVVGFFDYRNYTPDDDRFMPTGELRIDNNLVGHTVTDFVGSAFMIRRDDYLQYGVMGVEWHGGGMATIPDTTKLRWRGFETGSAAFAEDIEWKKRMESLGYKLAITYPDTMENIGFGLGRSTVVVVENGKPVVTKVHPTPYLLGNK